MEAKMLCSSKDAFEKMIRLFNDPLSKVGFSLETNFEDPERRKGNLKVFSNIYSEDKKLLHDWIIVQNYDEYTPEEDKEKRFYNYCFWFIRDCFVEGLEIRQKEIEKMAEASKDN